MAPLTPDLAEIETVVDGRRAALLVQHPLRPRILNIARQPTSATDIAALLGESRQKIGYHVRQLRRAGFLRAAGRRRKRGLVEHRFVASAAAYVLSPNVTGEASPDFARLARIRGAPRLVALATRLHHEAASLVENAAEQHGGIGALALERELQFASAEHRTAFAGALRQAIEAVIAEHLPGAQPTAPAPATAFRLLVVTHPIPGLLPSPEIRT
jgi:DNA-binding transcriptional ArsR family regulator